MHTRIIALLTLALACIGSAPQASAISKPRTSRLTESLTYNVYFHMGFIWAKAGSGILSLRDETGTDDQPRLHGQLAAKSHSIVEQIMKVRDTLDCYMSPQYVPIEFVKNTNEGSYQAIERNYYTSWPTSPAGPDAVDSTQVEIRRWRNKKGNDTRHLSVAAPAYDMLSSFYAIRRFDFDHMQAGDKRRLAIFSGIRMQWMTVEYVARERCQLRSGKRYQTLHVLLTFSTKDEDSTPLHVWLAETADHRPIKVIIQLSRIGAVQGEIAE